MKGRIKRIARWTLGAIIAGVLVVLVADWHVTAQSEAYCFDEFDQVPNARVAVVLGTSPRLTNGSENFFFRYRIEAAVELYKRGKIKRILVSGDNRTEYYNEPIAMQKALVEKGIPEDRIHLDYAGLRTLDSMVRTKDIFQQDSAIVVSQAFHNERAVYIGREKGLVVWGYNAKDVDAAGGFTVRLREMFARTKMLLDLYVLDTEPHHLGGVESIPVD